jgi:hypothetical protein
MINKKLITGFLGIALLISSADVHAKRSSDSLKSSFGDNIKNNNLTEAEVKKAQEAWGKALIQISSDFDKEGLKKATETARQIIDAAYGYNNGPVLFKPTLTSGEQTFRTQQEGALAYFVGGSQKYPNDSGFALKGWVKFNYQNAAVYIDGDVAMTMGHVMLTDKTGKVTTVDKTWAFKKGDDGKVRIVLHHSSLPYSPVTTVSAN